MAIESIAGSGARLINLSFTLTGIEDETNTVRDLTRAAYKAITAIQLAKMAWQAFLGTLGPAGWAMLGATIVAEVVIIKQEFTAREQVGARGQ